MNEYLQSYRFRNEIESSESIAFGCSHTWGAFVEVDEAWPYLLGSKNFGVRGCSSDLVARIAKHIVPQEKPSVVYCLWPNWLRFEIQKPDGTYCQSLPGDSNRIQFMQDHDENWCRQNFAEKVAMLREICDANNARLIDMTLYDMIPYHDHADRWPIGKDGHHFSPVWHRWVADLFQMARDTGKKFPISYE